MPVFFEGGDNAPFVAKMFYDCLDGLIDIADVVILQLLDVGWVNDVLCQAVDGDFFNSLQLTVLLLLDFVFRVEYCLVDEGGDVGVSVWGEWWCVQAVGCGGFVSVDRLNFLLVNDEGNASVSTSPLFCFH